MPGVGSDKSEDVGSIPRTPILKESHHDYRYGQRLNSKEIIMNLNGKLLIATPHLRDFNFSKTVIAIVNYSDVDGTTGLVLNTPVATKGRPDIQMAWSNIFGQKVDCKIDRLYIGGPVASNLMVAHDCEQFSKNEITPGTYVTNDRNDLIEIFQRNDISYRCFAGYAGWTPGQLENEIASGSWYISKNSRESVFYDCEPNDFWECQLQEWGRDLIADAICIDPKSMPKDPSMN